MKIRLPSLRLPSLLLLAPLLMASRCKGKDDNRSDNPIPIEEESPEKELQVASMEPSSGRENQTFKGMVYGAGFQRGARVRFGGIEAASVSFGNEGALQVTVPPLAAGVHDIEVINPDGESARLRGGLTILASSMTTSVRCDNAVFYFDFDSSAVLPGARAQIDEMAPCLVSSPGTIRLEGHCDERGTTEYNIALGQRRAEAVRTVLVSQGVPPSRITVHSWGEERPAVTGHDESAWSQNRRVELTRVPR